jgi:hypothetical protein
MSKLKLEDQIIHGLYSDIIFAEANFQVFEKIKLVYDDLGKLDKNTKLLFYYLLDSSKKMTILYLGRIYDNRSSKYDTRCLKELLHLIKEENLNTLNHPYYDNAWGNFKIKYKPIIEELNNNSPDVNANVFLDIVSKYINNDKTEKEDTLLSKIKKWRDKKLAHNESYFEDITLTEVDVKFLIEMPKSVLEFLNDFIEIPILTNRTENNHVSFIDDLINKNFKK